MKFNPAFGILALGLGASVSRAQTSNDVENPVRRGSRPCPAQSKTTTTTRVDTYKTSLPAKTVTATKTDPLPAVQFVTTQPTVTQTQNVPPTTLTATSTVTIPELTTSTSQATAFVTTQLDSTVTQTVTSTQTVTVTVLSNT